MNDKQRSPSGHEPDDRRERENERMRKGDTDRTLDGRPADPNRAGARIRIPPGVDAEDFRDPGRQTPDAPPVDNRS